MSSLSNLYPCNVLITSVVWKSFSKSAKQRITFSSALISLGMSRTDLNPLNGLKMSARQATTKKKQKIALNKVWDTYERLRARWRRRGCLRRKWYWWRSWAHRKYPGQTSPEYAERRSFVTIAICFSYCLLWLGVGWLGMRKHLNWKLLLDSGCLSCQRFPPYHLHFHHQYCWHYSTQLDPNFPNYSRHYYSNPSFIAKSNLSICLTCSDSNSKHFKYYW